MSTPPGEPTGERPQIDNNGKAGVLLSGVLSWNVLITTRPPHRLKQSIRGANTIPCAPTAARIAKLYYYVRIGAREMQCHWRTAPLRLEKLLDQELAGPNEVGSCPQIWKSPAALRNITPAYINERPARRVSRGG